MRTDHRQPLKDFPYAVLPDWQPAPKWPIWTTIWFVILVSGGLWAVLWLAAVTILHRGA